MISLSYSDKTESFDIDYTHKENSFDDYESIRRETLSTSFTKNYNTRSEFFGKSTSYLMRSFISDKDRIRFVISVMYPLYANLVEYYGDHETSIKIRNSVDGSSCLVLAT